MRLKEIAAIAGVGSAVRSSLPGVQFPLFVIRGVSGPKIHCLSLGDSGWMFDHRPPRPEGDAAARCAVEGAEQMKPPFEAIVFTVSIFGVRSTVWTGKFTRLWWAKFCTKLVAVWADVVLFPAVNGGEEIGIYWGIKGADAVKPERGDL